MEEMESQILKIVEKKNTETGGNNGNLLRDFNDILKMPILERDAFLLNMVNKKLIIFRECMNARMVMLPK